MSIPVWLTRQWEQCVQAQQTGRMPHALLLAGPPGLGKLAFAERLGALLLCQHRKEPGTNAACGQCPACIWHANGSHPDFVLVTPEEGKKQIGIDRIRDVSTLVSKTAHGSTQVVIVHPAEAMNRAAANALLKTLEEPNGSVVLILVSDHPAGLLPTIRSRCQLINCQPPSADLACNWLEQQLNALPQKADRPDARRLLGLADGLPFLALRLAETGQWAAHELICTQFMAALIGHDDVLQIAQEWSKLVVAEVLMIIATLVQDMVRLAAGATERQLYYPHRMAELAKVIAIQPPGQLWSLWQDILVARRRAISTANPNVVLLFEALLITYART